MKVFKPNIFTLLFSAFLFYIPSVLFAESEAVIEKAYPLNNDGRVYVENMSGDIVVKSWQKNEIKILARKVAKDKDQLEEAIVDIHQTDGSVRIVTRLKKPLVMYHSADVSVFYDLVIPDKAQLKVKSVSGRVRAWEIGGRVDTETVSGGTEIVKAGNGVECKTISGVIDLEEIIGRVSLRSTSGKISVDGIKGAIEANTVSGDIEVKRFSSADDIEMETIKGNMELQGELSPGGIYEFHTVSGRTRLALAPISEFELLTNTISGDMRCGFKLSSVDIMNRNKLQGLVGKGGASLKISSVNGDIIIDKGI